MSAPTKNYSCLSQVGSVPTRVPRPETKSTRLLLQLLASKSQICDFKSHKRIILICLLRRSESRAPDRSTRSQAQDGAHSLIEPICPRGTLQAHEATGGPRRASTELHSRPGVTAAAGCSRPHDPPPAVRAKQTACNVRGPTRSLERHSRSSLKVQGRRSRGWAWRSLFAGSSPTGAIRCGGGQTSIPAGFSALGLT